MIQSKKQKNKGDGRRRDARRPPERFHCQESRENLELFSFFFSFFFMYFFLFIFVLLKMKRKKYKCCQICERWGLSLLSLFSPSYLSQRDWDESRRLCLTAGSLRRSTSCPSGPFPTAVSFVRDGWSAFDYGAHSFSWCSLWEIAGFWLWRATFFSGGFGRLGFEFISDSVFIVLRFWVFDPFCF